MTKSRHVKVTSGGSSIAKAARLSSYEAYEAKGLTTIPTAEVADR